MLACAMRRRPWCVRELQPAPRQVEAEHLPVGLEHGEVRTGAAAAVEDAAGRASGGGPVQERTGEPSKAAEPEVGALGERGQFK